MEKIIIKNVKKTYEAGKLNSESIYNYKHVLYENSNYKSPKKMWKLIDIISADRVNEFNTLFKKPSFHFSGEFNFSVWCVEHKQAKFLIFSAKGYGTTYEVIEPKTVSEDTMISFIKEIYKLLKETIDN